MEIKGTLVGDPELRFTVSGLPMLTFDLRPFKHPKLEDDIRCVAWRDLAEKIANDDSYFGTRDAMVVVTGYFKNYEWKAQDGTHHSQQQFVLQGMWWA